MDCKAELIIVSGFLGAGKTTFIQHLINSAYAGERIAVLENEFGTVDLDGDTLRRSGVQVTSVIAGCICCNSAGSLFPAMEKIVKDFAPSLIIVEPTGIARMSDILSMMKFDRFRNLCTLRNVITIVDTKNYYKRMFISKEFFENQICASQIIFLSKTEGLGEDKVCEVSTDIAKIHPAGLIISQSWEAMDPQQVWQMLDEAEKKGISKGISVTHSAVNDFDTFVWSCSMPLPESAADQLFAALERGVFGEVLRVKGYIKQADSPARVFDYVPGEHKLGEKRNVSHSELCVIGRNLDKNAFDSMLSNM